MMFAALAASAELQALARALLHFVWQGTLIAAALRATLAILPPAWAKLRYRACCAALCSLLVAPLCTFWFALTREHLPAMRALAHPPGPSRAAALQLALLLVWALGSGLMSARLLFGFRTLGALVRRAQVPTGPWQAALDALATRLGVGRRVQLLLSAEIDAPIALGWLKPLILVPLAALTDLPPAELEALLAHELGHIQRHDYLVNVLQSCIEALFFYHPAVYAVSRATRVEREHCCDDIALQLTADPLLLARALAGMESLRSRLPEPALAASGGSLRQRIERIVLGARRKRAAPGAALGTALVLVCALGASLLGVWACGTRSEDTQATTSPLTARDGALAIRWLPEGVARHEQVLAAAAERHGLDPALLAIVTLVESLGDPNAESAGGAIGLMQLLPSTAAHVAAQEHLGDYSAERLREPAYNVDLGASYLSEQLADFGAQASPHRAIELAALAYNAGPQRLHAYLEGQAELPAETLHYRDLVMGMWNERERAESPTYAAWRERLRQAPPAAPGD
jgi:beta-lactamase regulating signal transducer with metallopeptidase domain